MILVLFAVIVAIPIGLLRGGSIKRLLAIHFRWVPFLALALLINVGIGIAVKNPGPDLKAAITIGTFLMALIFVLANVRLGGMRLAALGLLMNLSVIVANGAMPVSQDAARSIGSPISDLNDGLRHELLDHQTLLPWLADQFPLPFFNLVFSAGDVLLALGIGLLVVTQMTGPTRATRAVRGSVSG